MGELSSSEMISLPLGGWPCRRMPRRLWITYAAQGLRDYRQTILNGK
jgi:hypothetical protein